MNITVNFTGLVDIKNIKSGDTLKLPEGTDVSKLLSMLGIMEQHKKYIIVMINGVKETLFRKVNNNDEINLFLPVGGG